MTLVKSIDEWLEDGRFSRKVVEEALKEALATDEEEVVLGTDVEGHICKLRIQQGTKI